MAGGPVVVETSPLIFIFHMISHVHRGGGQPPVFSMYPRRWLSLNSRAISFKLQGRHKRFVGDSASHTSHRGAPLLVGDTAKVVSPSASQVQSLMLHNYIPLCTVYTGVQHSSLHCLLTTVDVPVYRPPVYRFALFTGVFFSCHPATPVYRWYAGIPGWFIFHAR